MVDCSTYVNIESSWAPCIAKQSYVSIHSAQVHKNYDLMYAVLLLLFSFRAVEFPANLLLWL